MTEDEHDAVKHYADQEQRSLSDMARILLAEAVAARTKPDYDWRRLRELEREFGIREDSE